MKRAKCTRVKQNKTVGANKIDATSSSLAAKKEDELLPFRIVELIDKFLPFRDGHGTIESETSVPEQVFSANTRPDEGTTS